jgi:hypothetical protein
LKLLPWTDPLHRLRAPRQDVEPSARARKDSAKALLAQIHGQEGSSDHPPPAETFDRRQAANARIVKLDFPVFFAYYFASSIKYPFTGSHFRMFADVIH